MSYVATYIGDSYKRLFWGVIADARVNIPAVKDQIGAVIKAYVDSQTALVIPGTLPYKIETTDGNLVGYFVIQMNQGPPFILLQQLRPAFVQFQSDISSFISTFILNNGFVYDSLN